MADPIKLKDFQGEFRKRGLHRKTLFYVEMTAPPALVQLLPNQIDRNKLLGLFCHEANIPSQQLMTQDLKEPGIRRHALYDYTTNELTLDFYMDTQNVIRAYFDAWLNEMINRNDYSFGYFNNYAVDGVKVIVIQHALDTRLGSGAGSILPQSAEVMSIEFTGLTLKNIGDMTLSWGAQRSISTLPVTFEYSKMKMSNRYLVQDINFQEIPPPNGSNNLINSPFFRKVVDTVGRKLGFGKALDLGYVLNNVINNNVDIFFNRSSNPITGNNLDREL